MINYTSSPISFTYTGNDADKPAIHVNANVLLQEWEYYLLASSKAERTIRGYLSFLRHMWKLFETPPHLLTQQQCSEKLRDPLLSKSTRFTYHTIMRVWFQWLNNKGYRADDPTLVLGKPKFVHGTPRPAETKHLNTIFQKVRFKPETGLYILLAARQGLRCCEIAQIKGEDVDTLTNQIRIIGKGGHDATLDLDMLVRDYAARIGMPTRGWWFPSPLDTRKHVSAKSVSETVSKAFSRMGSPVTAHMLRHWHATELTRNGVPTRIVQQSMRHKNIATTALYAKVVSGQIADALELLPTIQFNDYLNSFDSLAA